MPRSWFQNLQDNLNINKQLIHKFAHLLYSNVNKSCFGHPSWDLSQDRSIVASDPTRELPLLQFPQCPYLCLVARSPGVSGAG